VGRLTKRQVESVRKPGRYGDGEGLWLQVSATGGRSWILRYQRKLASSPELPDVSCSTVQIRLITAAVSTLSSNLRG
jgi:hypothetical protein